MRASPVARERRAKSRLHTTKAQLSHATSSVSSADVCLVLHVSVPHMASNVDLALGLSPCASSPAAVVRDLSHCSTRRAGATDLQLQSWAKLELVHPIRECAREDNDCTSPQLLIATSVTSLSIAAAPDALN